MVFRDFVARQQILDKGEQSIRNVLVQRHPTLEGANSQKA